MIIDSHVHLMPGRVRENRDAYLKQDIAFGMLYASPKAKLVSQEQIVDYLDDSGIDRAVVFGFPWESHELVSVNNDEVWDFAAKFPDRIIPFAVLSTLGGDKAHKETERTLAAGFRGIGELAMYHGGWSLADFEALEPSIELAEMAHAPVIIHVNEPVGHEYPGKIAVDFRGLLRIIKANPEVDFILAHFGGGIFFYSLMPEIAGIMARTYIDTAASPYLYDPKIYEIASRIMGPSKILFGSDYPLLPLSRYVRDLETAGISPQLKAAILGENASALFAEPRKRRAFAG